MKYRNIFLICIFLCSNSSCDSSDKPKEKPHRLCCGTILLVVGIASIIWTPTYLLLKEKLMMMPGLPTFELWKDPPQNTLAKVYIFNITNSQRFLSGQDAKLKVEEVGPVVYRELFMHNDIVFNDNDTITYNITHKAVLAPELTHIDLNATITVANIPILVALSYFADAPFYIKLPLNYFVKASYSDTLINLTVYQYLHNWKNPIVDILHKLVPSIVPVNNLGAMETLYRNNSSNRITAFIGQKHGLTKYMLMDKYDGNRKIPYQDDACRSTMLNATEGAVHTPHITKNRVIRYFKKSTCIVFPLYYESEAEMSGLTAYKYLLLNNSFDRTYPSEYDCYKGKPVLPNGLMDMSKCYNNVPVAASFPHFLYGDPKIQSYVDGLEPNSSLHESYLLVEPTSGLPLKSAGRCQSNLVITSLSGMDEVFDKFSDLVIPMLWVECLHPRLPVFLENVLYFAINILPVTQWIFTATMLILGTVLVCDYVRKRKDHILRAKKERGNSEN